MGLGGGGGVFIIQMTMGATLSMHTLRVQLTVLLHVGTEDQDSLQNCRKQHQAH